MSGTGAPGSSSVKAAGIDPGGLLHCAMRNLLLGGRFGGAFSWAPNSLPWEYRRRKPPPWPREPYGGPPGRWHIFRPTWRSRRRNSVSQKGILQRAVPICGSVKDIVSRSLVKFGARAVRLFSDLYVRRELILD
jgi:hypothetical protein